MKCSSAGELTQKFKMWISAIPFDAISSSHSHVLKVLLSILRPLTTHFGFFLSTFVFFMAVLTELVHYMPHMSQREGEKLNKIKETRQSRFCFAHHFSSSANNHVYKLFQQINCLWFKPMQYVAWSRRLWSFEIMLCDAIIAKRLISDTMNRLEVSMKFCNLFHLPI